MQDSAQPFMDEVYNKCLILIEDAVLALGGRNIQEYSLPQPNRSEVVLGNREYLKETNYDTHTLAKVVSSSEGLLTDEQLYVYQQVLNSIEDDAGPIFFLDALEEPSS